MAWLGLGIFYTGVVVGIPTVTGVAEGVSHQKKQNEDAANEERMVKFYLDAEVDRGDPPRALTKSQREVDGLVAVMHRDRVWLAPRDPGGGEGPGKLRRARAPPIDGGGGGAAEGAAAAEGEEEEWTPHPFTGFYIQYPDEERNPPERGLVSTISVDPPMLNWVYVDSETQQLRYGNRTQSIAHKVGDWDWTDPGGEEGEEGSIGAGWVKEYGNKAQSGKDEEERKKKEREKREAEAERHRGLMLDGWEGFVAVREREPVDGLWWSLYFDEDDDGLDKGRLVGGRRRVEVALNRRVLPEETRRRQDEEADKKLQVKTQGDLKTQWG